ncbi:hypothetical protein Pint_18317 [Pistacia integerrima]|uniref:Uncharacterized protein n=1 Tax=Pistacia integerrima TaxID=434235 RepID=A0ACC0YTS2_9ROSI|nr:hypothetical protein Pint_18317 [Pistacia integerrima]
MRCCSHILNLIIKDRLSVIEGDIEKIGDSVSYWLSTPKRVENFEDTTCHVDEKYTKNLVRLIFKLDGTQHS